MKFRFYPVYVLRSSNNHSSMEIYAYPGVTIPTKDRITDLSFSFSSNFKATSRLQRRIGIFQYHFLFCFIYTTNICFWWIEFFSLLKKRLRSMVSDLSLSIHTSNCSFFRLFFSHSISSVSLQYFPFERGTREPYLYKQTREKSSKHTQYPWVRLQNHSFTYANIIECCGSAIINFGKSIQKLCIDSFEFVDIVFYVRVVCTTPS